VLYTGKEDHRKKLRRRSYWKTEIDGEALFTDYPLGV
jgi:hypothetical protein